MIRPRAGLAFPATPGHVTDAILICAEERSALLHALCDAGFSRVETVRRSLRIADYFAVLRDLLIIIGAIPIGAPFPNVARHVGQTISIGRKRAHRGRSREAVISRIAVREMALESVRLKLAAGLEFPAPNVGLAVQSTARREFELGFCGQAFTGPFRVSRRILPPTRTTG